MMIGLFYFLLLALFFGVQLYFWWIWKMADGGMAVIDSDVPAFVTILIPVRNEEACIAKCLKSITGQNYPPTRLQIIAINDHSSDRTTEIIREFPEVEMIDLPDGITEKKMAIQFGIEQAKGEVIMTIDGDCEVGNNWVNSMVVNLIQDSDTLITGPVWMIPMETSFIQKYQEMEQAALNMLTYSGVTSGLILSASGANLAYPKSLFTKLDPYADNQDIASGDDVFFAHKVHDSGGSIFYARQWESVVFTNPETSFSRFISQRMRWSGKSSAYSHRYSRLYLAGFSVVNVSFVVMLIAGIWNPVFFTFVVVGLMIKFLIDYLIIHTGMRWGRRPVCWQDALKASLFQIFYVNYITLLLILGYKPTWKERAGN